METRILSVIGYYYLAFFAIGVAMLGMTAGALAVFYREKLEYLPKDLFELMPKIMAAFGWSVLASLIALLSIAVGARLQPTLTFVVNWAVVLLVLLPPYFLLGAAVSLALTRSVQRVNIVYGVDLVGASVGRLVTLLLLDLTDTYTAVLVVGALGAAAGFAFQTAMDSASGREISAQLFSESPRRSGGPRVGRWGEPPSRGAWSAPACRQGYGRA